MNEGTNSVNVALTANSVSVEEPSNSVDASWFSVSSAYYLLTQFQPYRHDTKVGAEE